MEKSSYHRPCAILLGSKLYWAVCIPNITYGSEVIDLNGETMHMVEAYHAEIAKNVQGLQNHAKQYWGVCCSGVATHEKLYRTSVSALLKEAASAPNGMHIQPNPYFQILLYHYERWTTQWSIMETHRHV